MKRNSQKIPLLSLSLLIVIVLTLMNPNSAYASETISTNGLNSKTNTPVAIDNKLKIDFPKEELTANTQFNITAINELPLPWRINILSSTFQYDIKNIVDNKKIFTVSINYDKNTNNLKQIFFYDRNLKNWKPLPSIDNPSEKKVTAKTNFLFSQLAVFEYPNVLTVGKASWYKHKNGLFAASPDFPIGTRLRVYNLDRKNIFVDVVVNDFGPDRELHPERVIDLDKEAFKKIASLGQGTAKIRIEPLSVPSVRGMVLNVPKTGLVTDLKLTSKSAIIFDSQNQSIVWSKNASTSLPIASLTKLMAIKVFLDTQPSLNKVVSYNKADEEYNFKYAKKWEIALLKIDHGDTLTIEDLLYSALVGSANNAVESLVRVSGLSRENFIKKMNEQAEGWGAKSTKFVEPTGLAPENVSSASDYAIISTKALSHPIIEKATKIINYKFTTKKLKKPHTIKNTNKLISYGDFKITGSKTGYLNEASYCLMTRAENKRKKQLIVITLGAPTRDLSFNETEELLYYGFSKIR